METEGPPLQVEQVPVLKDAGMMQRIEKWNTLRVDGMPKPMCPKSTIEMFGHLPDRVIGHTNNALPHLNDFVGRDIAIPCDATVISNVTTGNFSSDKSNWKRLAETRLHGRDKEVGQLEQAYNRICDPEQGDSEVVFVYGHTGTGKSALLETLRNPIPVGDAEPYFASGKFDLLTKNEPFSALVNVFMDICDHILQSDELDELDEMKESITKALGTDKPAMTSLISNLSTLISDNNETHSASNKEEFSVPNAARFRLVCCSFLRAVATKKHPVIVFFDDVHWADQASADIIKALLTDTLSKHILIVLAYRSSEVDLNSPIRRVLELKGSSELPGEKCLSSTEIELGNLPVETINMIICTVTDSEPEVTKSLSEVVLQKTHGNAFFVLQFLDMLASCRQLVFSLENLKWEWDVDKIITETNVSDNVGELITSRIQRLHQSVIECLKVASCLGFSFNDMLLRKILYSELSFREGVEHCDESSQDSGELLFRESVNSMLENAILEGMIDKCGHRYKFTHDKIQSSFYDMIPEGKERGMLHLRIGKVVRTNCATDQDPLLFLAADQTNRGLEFVDDAMQKVDLAKLNLMVAKLAKGRSGYLPAAKYLRIAYGLLDREKWKEHYDLSLEIASFGAEMESCSAHFLRCRELVDEILAHSVSRHDRLRGYYAMIESLRAEDRLVDALDLGLKVLAQFSVAFPRKPSTIHIVTSLALATSQIPKNIDDILKLPTMTNEDHLACMKMMSILAQCAYFLERGREFVLISLRMMRFTLRYGLTSFSSQAIGTFGMIKASIGRYDDGFAFGRLAMRHIEMMNSREVEAPTICVVCCFTSHWKMSLESLIAPLYRAYTSGLATSEIGAGLISGYNRIVIMASLGTPLDQVDDEILALQRHCYEFKHDSVMHLVAPTHQAVLNFQGRSTFPMILTGAIMEQISFTDDARIGKNIVLLHSIAINQLKLALHFQEWYVVADILPTIEKYRIQWKGVAKHFSVYDFTLVAGISYAVLWQRTGKKRNLKMFHRALKQAKSWLASGLKQCEATYSFLLAEQQVFESAGAIRIKQAYDKAIHDLKEAKLLHFQAFANDRAGTVLTDLKLQTDARPYFIEAQVLYTQYGAHAKVDRLDRKIESWRV